MKITYQWNWSPTRDYTLKVFSKQNLSIKDDRDKTYEWHMDGDYPNGFTLSSYYKYGQSWKPSDFGPKSLIDVFMGAKDFDNFLSLLYQNIWTLFWWFNTFNI
mgnify:CR=1 FL=1